MSEIKHRVHTYLINYGCDVVTENGNNCEGIMRPTGETCIKDTAAPPQYPHECSFCDTRMKFSFKYPKTVYEYE